MGYVSSSLSPLKSTGFATGSLHPRGPYAVEILKDTQTAENQDYQQGYVHGLEAAWNAARDLPSDMVKNCPKDYYMALQVLKMLFIKARDELENPSTNTSK